MAARGSTTDIGCRTPSGAPRGDRGVSRVPRRAHAPQYASRVNPLRARALVRTTVVTVAALGGATALVALLQDGIGVPNPSAVYILAVAVVALVGGRLAVLVAAIASFLLYDLLFVDPRLTLTVADPGEWVNLVLLLAVGLLVGQMAALLRIREETAVAREREARTLFSVSRELATRPSTLDVLPRIVQIVCREAGLNRVWIALDDSGGRRRPVADTEPGAPVPEAPGHRILRRRPGDEPADWVAVHTGKRTPERRAMLDRAGSPAEAFRVAIEAGGRGIGSIWGLRTRADGPPDLTETRLLAAVADQVGQALEQDRLAAVARDADIAQPERRAQARAPGVRLPRPADAAGLHPRRRGEIVDRQRPYRRRTARERRDDRPRGRPPEPDRHEPPGPEPRGGRRARVERDVYDLADLLGRRWIGPPAAGRTPAGGGPATSRRSTWTRSSSIRWSRTCWRMRRSTRPPGQLVRISARSARMRQVRLTVEDAGPGVPEASLPHLFEKFYRVPGRSRGSRSAPVSAWPWCAASRRRSAARSGPAVRAGWPRDRRRPAGRAPGRAQRHAAVALSRDRGLPRAADPCRRGRRRDPDGPAPRPGGARVHGGRGARRHRRPAALGRAPARSSCSWTWACRISTGSGSFGASAARRRHRS